MDRLAPFFERFSLTARMFYSGLLCGSTLDQESGHAGHLHVLRNGRLKITRPHARQMVIDTPSIVFFPRPRRHRLHGPQLEGAELVCATIEFGAGMLNPLIASFPEPLVLPLDALPELGPPLQLLFSEAFSESPGRQTALDRLFEYLFVLLIRSAMKAHLVDSGVLIGLSDVVWARQSRACINIPKLPGRWNNLLNAPVCPVRDSLLIFARLSA